jgi:hypothetical protein
MPAPSDNELPGGPTELDGTLGVDEYPVAVARRQTSRVRQPGWVSGDLCGGQLGRQPIEHVFRDGPVSLVGNRPADALRVARRQSPK